MLNRFGFNIGYANQPFFISAFLDHILQAKMPRGWNVPKSLTKFFGESGKLTIEHIARYTVEIGEV